MQAGKRDLAYGILQTTNPMTNRTRHDWDMSACLRLHAPWFGQAPWGGRQTGWPKSGWPILIGQLCDMSIFLKACKHSKRFGQCLQVSGKVFWECLFECLFGTVPGRSSDACRTLECSSELVRKDAETERKERTRVSQKPNPKQKDACLSLPQKPVPLSRHLAAPASPDRRDFARSVLPDPCVRTSADPDWPVWGTPKKG